MSLIILPPLVDARRIRRARVSRFQPLIYQVRLESQLVSQIPVHERTPPRVCCGIDRASADLTRIEPA